MCNPVMVWTESMICVIIKDCSHKTIRFHQLWFIPRLMLMEKLLLHLLTFDYVLCFTTNVYGTFIKINASLMGSHQQV